MKKVLFASTALVAFAGAAAADISISGNAEMGIMGNNTPGSKTGFFTDIDATFTMSGETDGGLTFGASVDLDESGSAAAAMTNNADDGGATMFIQGGFGTLTMGDTDGALDWALTEAGQGGSLADDHTSHAAYLGSYLDGAYDGQILRYNYSFGDFGFAISAELNDELAAVGVATVDAANGYAIGFTYGLDLGGTTVNLGLGHQTIEANAAYAVAALAPTHMFSGTIEGDSIDATGVSASATFGGGITGTVTYTSFDHTQALLDGDHMSVGLGYSANGLTVTANYGDFDSNTNALDRDGYGVSVGYDLGGGAQLQAGYGSGSIGAAASSSTWSMGLRMDF